MKEKEDLLGHVIFTRSEYPTPGIAVYLHNKKHGYLLPVRSQEHLQAFGFYTAGPELGTLRLRDYQGTYEDRIKATVEILSENYDRSRKGIKYWDIKDFMNSRAKTLPTKKMKSSYQYVFNYLEEEYQDLWKFAEAEAVKDDK